MAVGVKKVTAAEILARRRAAPAKPRRGEECLLTKPAKRPRKEPAVRASEKKHKAKRARAPASDQSLEALLKHLSIPADGWDYVIVGDGSGTTLEHGCGSASVLIERTTMKRTEFGATLSHGTNIMAELFAYVVPLLYLSHNKMPRSSQGVRVHVITDCQHLPMAWEHRHSRKKNCELWKLLESFKRRGVILSFHWIPRDTWDLNRYCDTAAGLRRKSQEKISTDALSVRGRKSIYDFNPITE